MTTPDLITVATFTEPMQASLARTALDSAGIDSFLRSETANSLIPIAFESQLQVSAVDETAARAILSAFTDDPESLASVTAAEESAQ